jgi:PAS domain S-box-containing protein
MLMRTTLSSDRPPVISESPTIHHPITQQPVTKEKPLPLGISHEAWRADDERYRLLIENITDYAIYMLSPTGEVASWNAGAQRCKGYQSSEIIGRHFSTFYTDEDRAQGLPEHALRISAAEGKFECEGWRVRKDGSRFWAYVVIDPIRLPTGELAGFAKIVRDLTDRRAAEQTLRANQEQFRLLVNGVTDYAIYMLGPTGEISSWNSGAERIKGFTAQEVIGTHFSRFYIPEDRAADEPARALAIARAEGRYEKEGQRVRKDGSVFWAHVVIDTVRDADGTLLGFAKITRDITARRESRKALDAARESLFQVQKMDAIGQLTGGVAHDFNNLLMVILGSLELLRKRVSDDARAMSLLENAVTGAKRGAALTQRMLAFARRQELVLESIDIPALVAGMSDLLERSLGTATELEMHFPLKLAAVRTDANQLELAILNLVVNARDAMPGGGSIIVSAKEHEVAAKLGEAMAPGRYVCLSVSDSGEGMDAATLARASEPFFTTKGVGKGTGLGLPMVRGVAEQSGGQLVLKSEKNRGTTAELWLPCAASEPLDKPADSGSRKAVAERPLLVLAVDDDSLVLNSTVAMLEDLGHRVLQAASAREALALIDAHADIELLITDHSMPGMSGAELAGILEKESPGIPIVIATGFAELPAGNANNLTRLAKPFSQGELELAVSIAMRASRTKSTASPDDL